jgi:molybdate transport system substrate-binding protein
MSASERTSSLTSFGLLLTLLLLVLATGCGVRSSNTSTIIVYAAASLTDVMTDLARTYELRNPGREIVFNFGSSSQLALQILDGAPADLFASANLDQLERVGREGELDGSIERFATNRLVLITPVDNTSGIRGLADLGSKDLQLIVAVEGVPIREYTEQVFGTLAEQPDFGPEWLNQVRKNVVSEEESVRFLSAKVALGEASAAIVYRSDVTPDLRDRLSVFEIDHDLSPLAEYYVAPIAGGARSSSLGFVEFILSPQGQSVLESWGFGPARDRS